MTAREQVTIVGPNGVPMVHDLPLAGGVQAQVDAGHAIVLKGELPASEVRPAIGPDQPGVVEPGHDPTDSPDTEPGVSHEDGPERKSGDFKANDPDDDRDGQAIVKRPADSALKPAWVDYALAVDPTLTRDEAEQMNKADIVNRYGARPGDK